MRWLQRAIPHAILMGFLAFLVIVSVLFPAGHRVLADGAGVSDLSLYERASELTREFATALAPGSGVDRMYMLETTTDDDAYLVAGNAGAMLGYAEILSDDSGIVGWLMNSYTAASSTITYDQLRHVMGDDSDHQAALGNPFFQYAGYGEVLTDMGLISTVRPGIGKAINAVGSGFMLLVYMLANAAPFLFKVALTLLTTLNPFKLFETVLYGTASADLGVISGIAEYVGSIYESVQTFSILFLFPMLLAGTLFSVLVFRKGSAMKRFARYGLRVFMLFAGLPLIGATYTGLIEDLDSKVAVGSEYADYLILSSYVDVEDWVKYSRLAPPSDFGIRHPQINDGGSRALSTRELVLNINGTRAANWRALELKDRYSATSDIGVIMDEGGDQLDVDSNLFDQSDFVRVAGMLTRHMTSATYSGSDYSGEVSGQIQKIRGGSDNEDDDENIVKMYSLSATDSRTWIDKANVFSDDPDWMEPIHWNGAEGEGTKTGDNERNSAKGLFTEGNALNDLFKFGTYRMNIYNSGDLRYNRNRGYVSPNMPDVVSLKPGPIGEERIDTVGGLSPIGMYNFLNTTFTSTGMTVFSPEKTSSDLSRDSYGSVSFAETGISALMRWVENITVMFGLAALAIAYGLMMVSVAIKSLPRILSGVFGTAFGSIAFTTKLLISTAVLIIQVVGIIFMYALSENIIMTLLLNFNELVDTGSSYFGSGTLILHFVSSFLVIAVTSAVTIFMIKNMKLFKEMMEEVVTNTINRVMGVLDTGTGGQGLDVGKTSGGRVGGDGKLTEAAKQADGRGLTGAMEHAAGGGLLRDAAGLMGEAHGLEARREQTAQELNKDTGGLGSKIKSRIGTAKDLMGARGKDVGKGALGIDGKSLDREMDAKNRRIDSMLYNKDAQDDFADSRGTDDSDDAKTATTGENEHGDKVDANGKVISSSSPLAMIGSQPMTAEDGALLDADGNTYTDEMGNAFYQNDKGHLVDESGNFVALDKDGTLQPVTDIPGHSGNPVPASKEAAQLDSMRFDGDQYEAMTGEQDEFHYGLDKDGHAIGLDGAALYVNGVNGRTPAQLDDQGFVTDTDGNYIPASEISSSVDDRGFETVKDKESGETHLRHKGDAAMKHAKPPRVGDNSNATDLAKNANRANRLAKRADERVKKLQADGASPYAIMQAQRHADTMHKNAGVAQQAFNQAMQAKSDPTAKRARQSVTDEHVQSASRQVRAEQSALTQQKDKLQQMANDGSSPKVIARQKRKVDAQRAVVNQAMNTEKDLRTAKSSGRPYQEVRDARSRVESAENLYQKAQRAHAGAVANGEPRKVVQQRAQKMNQAANVLSSAQSNLARVSQKPSGTPEQIDKASAHYEQSQGQYKQSQASVKHWEQQRQTAQEANRHQHKAKQQYDRASNRVKQLEQSGASAQTIRAAERTEQQAKAQYERATSRVDQLPYTSRQATKELRTARANQAQAKQQVSKAQRTKQRVLNPAGWGSKKQELSRVQSAPSRSVSSSYAALTASGVSSYDDYRNQLQKEQTSLTSNQSKLKQAEHRLASFRSGNRPPQIIKQAEDQVKTLKSGVNASQSNVKNLKDNVQGLLKNGSFQPGVASKPIRTNGTAIINQMVHMNHSQGLYDKLAHQAKTGVISEAGRKQMTSLDGQLSNMKRDLMRSGIREDALKDKTAIAQSARHMQQSWDSFVNGTTVENEE